MKKATLLRSLAFLLAIPYLATSVHAQEQSIKRKDVPKAILAAFEKTYPKAKIKGYAKEVEEGKTVYEVESVEGSVHRDITYMADASVASIEESLPVSELPDVIRSAAEKQYPKSKISLCEKVTKGSVIQYELVVTSGKQKYELVLNPDGTVAKTEKK